MSTLEVSKSNNEEVGGASAPPSSLPREEREVLMRKELVEYFSTGIEPKITPHNGQNILGDKLLRCQNCGSLVWKKDKKALREDHEGHMFSIAVGGSVEEALRLKYDLIRSEKDDD